MTRRGERRGDNMIPDIEKIIEGYICTWRQDIRSRFKELYDDEEFKDMLVAVYTDGYNLGRSMRKEGEI